jgi:hypothetical protein
MKNKFGKKYGNKKGAFIIFFNLATGEKGDWSLIPNYQTEKKLKKMSELSRAVSK